MSVNVHIEHIGDTEANVRANMDLLQLGILTDTNREMVYTNDDNTRLYYLAAQYYWDGASATYVSAIHADVTATGNMYTGEYQYHYGDTDTYWRYETDEMTQVVGGVEMWNYIEDGTQDMAYFNSGRADVDMIIDTTVADTLVIQGSDGYIGVHISAPAYLVHIYEGDSSGVAEAGFADTLVLESSGAAGMSVLVGDDNQAMFFFADQDDTGWFTWQNDVFKFYPDGAVNAVQIAAAATTINAGSVDHDFQVNWDSGVGLFVQGSDGYSMFGGSSAPDSLVHMWAATAGTVTAVAGTILTVENSDSAYVSILGPATATQGIYFGDAADNDVGGLLYAHATDQMIFRIAGGTLLTIDTTNGFHWNAASVDQNVQFESNGDAHLLFLDGGTDKACVSTGTPLAAKLTILQDDSSGESCLSLSQADESEGVIDFVASDRGAILATVNSTGSVRVELNGTVVRLATYADA